MLGFTGSFRGKPVSVQATGMGCPSAATVAEELTFPTGKQRRRSREGGGVGKDVRQGGDLGPVRAGRPAGRRRVDEERGDANETR
jgi:uridine phosphorylase